MPFPIACGACFACKREQYSLCENSNPNAWMAEKLWGHSPAGIFGYSHLVGGYAGGQAEYVRVPFADVGPLRIESDLDDDKVLFLSDILPTGWMAAENANVRPGDTVVVWGCGPVGQFAMIAARLMGADRVIGIDRFPERLALARRLADAETIDYEEIDVLPALRDMTAGRGADGCIDAVGMEAHGHGLVGGYDQLKHSLRLETDRPDRAARGDPRLPQRRHGLGAGRLRRLRRQVPAGLADEPLADAQHRARRTSTAT